ncbi:MAG: serine/threonine protein kinase [Deltaproteobacteria bacterium]|nr:serine/threonine protein kinase [Deltaproteobacteria bacterium]
MGESFAAGLVGIVLDGRYRLDALIGEGGMGAVFRATHLAMERKVAVKLLKPHLTDDELSLQRFAREARSTLKVESPHAVKVLDFGVTPLGDYYMVLEYLDGRTVQRELDVDGPFAPARVVHIARHALRALGAAHAIGLVHRDIKPDNLLLMRVGDDPDYTKVLDFGVAKLMEGAATAELALTAVGTVFGTPEFMSPEQACGYSLDGRSDLYSLAATMFAMLTGCALFEGKSAMDWLMHHARTPPPHLSMVSSDFAAYPELDELLQRCLSKQRELRPRDAAEMSELLATIEPTLGRRPGAVPSPSSRVTVFSQSTYFKTLPPDARETLPPSPAGGTQAADAVPRRSRAPLIVALLGAAVVITAIVLFATKKSRGVEQPPKRDAGLALPSSPDATAIDPAIDPVIVAAPPDAAPPDAAPPDAVPPDAVAVAAVPDAGVRSPPRDAAPARDPRRDKLAEHLAAAEGVFQSGGSPLTQLIQADHALRLDPGNVRATFLLGDAQLRSNDVDRGCATLRAIRRYGPAAQRIARSCPK